MVNFINSPGAGAIVPPHIKRMMDEGDELAQRLGKLNAFKDTDTFKALAPLDAHMLTLQAEIMQSYLHVLTIRLARASDAAKGLIPDAAGPLHKITTGKLDVN